MEHTGSGSHSGNRDPMAAVVFFMTEAVKKATVLFGIPVLLCVDILVGAWVYKLSAKLQIHLNLFVFEVSLGWLLEIAYSAIQIILAYYIFGLWRGKIDLGSGRREKTLALALLMVAAVVSVSNTIGDLTIVEPLFRERNPLEFSFEYFLHGENVPILYRVTLVTLAVVCGLNEFLVEFVREYYAKKLGIAGGEGRLPSGVSDGGEEGLPEKEHESFLWRRLTGVFRRHKEGYLAPEDSAVGRRLKGEGYPVESG